MSYVTIAANHSGLVLDVSDFGGQAAIVRTCGYVNQTNQQWSIQDIGEGYVTIAARHSGLVLDVSDFGGQTAIVRTCGYVNQANQQWRIQDLGNGFVTIAARHSGLVLDVSDFGGQTAIVRTCGYVNQTNQQWRIQDIIPLFTAQRGDDVHSGHMDTKITLSRDGQLTGTTRTWTNCEFEGFHGGVQVVIFTSNGNAWVSGSHEYGVDGIWVPNSPSDRTDVWQEQVPLSIAENAERCAIIHSWVPTWRFYDILDEFKRGLKSVSEVAIVVAEIIIPLAA